MDAANVTPIRKDNTAALRQRRSRAKQAAIPSQENPNKNKNTTRILRRALVVSENGGEDEEVNMFKMLVTTLALALPAQVEAFQLSCAHEGGYQIVSLDGKITTTRQDFEYQMTVDVDPERKTISTETSEGHITRVTGAVIDAYADLSTPGATYKMSWRLNRVTGELNFNEDWTGSAGYRSTLDYHTFKCVPAKDN
jgi:hypothetical protein